MRTIDETELQVIKRQEEFLEQIITEIRNTPLGPIADLKEISDNISQLKEEIKVGKPDDLPSLFDQLHLQYSMASKFSKQQDIPDPSSPYFGFMRLKEKGTKRERNLFLGHIAFAAKGANFRVVDWKTAPVAQIYYNFNEGEEYELDLPDRSLEGTLVEKNVLTIANGKLLRIDRIGKSYQLISNEWRELKEEDEKLEGGQGAACRSIGLGTGRTNFTSPDVISLLDKDQFNLLNMDDQNPLLVIGGAGCGKTTVALHRVATLCFQKKYIPRSILVVVAGEGLARLSKKLLANIGLFNVRVMTARDWFRDQAFRMISNIPRKRCPITPCGVGVLKRHLSLEYVLKAFIARKEKEISQRLKELTGLSEVVEYFCKRSDLPFLKRFEKIEQRFRDLSPILRIKINEEKKHLFDINSDRHEIFTDKELLQVAVEHSNGVVTNRIVNETVRHTIYQFKTLDEDSDYASDTLDGKSVHHATPFEISGTIDDEDFPVMLRLLWLKTGIMATPKGQLKKYNHIVLDEAQELAPIELKTFAKSLSDDGSFTVAGDAAQQTDETISFLGWDKLLDHLEVPQVNAHELSISYRSPKTIVDFAHYVLGDLAPKELPTCSRKGKPVKFTPVQHRAHASIVVNELLADLVNREPNASIAVVCNKFEWAKNFYNELSDIGKVRLVEAGEFNFKPGIDVTTVDQVKGLEFDYVVIPDADSYNYPDQPMARRRLHLAATRAIHQLWVLHSTNVSPLVKSYLDR